MKHLINDLLAPQSNSVIESNILIMRQEGFTSDLVTRFKNTFEGIYNNVTKTLNSIINDSYDYSNRTASKNSDFIHSLEKKIHALNYVSNVQTILPCPDGFKDDWPSYVNSVEKMRAEVTLVALNTLEDFNIFLSSFIGDKNVKMSIKDLGREYKALSKKREDQEKILHSYFSHGSNQRQTMSKMFENKEIIVPSLKTSVETWNTMIKTKPTELKARCDAVAKKMESIIELASSKQDINVSKEMLINLSEGGYETARQVEHLAKFIARCEINMVTSGNIAERLLTVIK